MRVITMHLIGSWWNQLQQAGANVLVVDRVVSCYYFSDTNKTSTGSRSTVQEMYRVIKNYGPIRGYLGRYISIPISKLRSQSAIMTSHPRSVMLIGV